MIRITISGNSWDIRKRLNDAKFRWNPKAKQWWKVVAESELNSTLESLRPMRSWSDNPTPVIVAMLESVDVNGNNMNDKSCAFKLAPVGETEGADFLEQFQNEVDVQLSPNNCAPSAPETEKKKKYDREGFY